jgi:hypothetical protein
MMDLILGDDGKPSLRRILALVCFVAGIVSVFFAQFDAEHDWFDFVPCAILFLVGLLLIGILTVQSITTAVAVIRGKEPPKEEGK